MRSIMCKFFANGNAKFSDVDSVIAANPRGLRVLHRRDNGSAIGVFAVDGKEIPTLKVEGVWFALHDDVADAIAKIEAAA